MRKKEKKTQKLSTESDEPPNCACSLYFLTYTRWKFRHDTRYFRIFQIQSQSQFHLSVFKNHSMSICDMMKTGKACLFLSKWHTVHFEKVAHALASCYANESISQLSFVDSEEQVKNWFDPNSTVPPLWQCFRVVRSISIWFALSKIEICETNRDTKSNQLSLLNCIFSDKNVRFSDEYD